MEIEDLLDKSERYQVRILRKLLLNGGQISYRELFSSLQIAKPSFDKYLQNIQDLAAVSPHLFAFERIDDELVLRLEKHHTLQEICCLYIKDSLKFQVLDYIYQYQEFTVPQLTNQLLVSEASFYRRLKEINGFLKEFDIQIRNGKMRGEELQIRYFFFQLYWFLEPYTNHQINHTDSWQSKTVRVLERNLDVVLHDHDRQRLNLWMIITRKRIQLKYKTYWQLRRSIIPFQENELYKKLKETVFRFLSRYSFEAEEEEAMIFFVFLVSMSILPEEFYENQPAELKLIAFPHAEYYQQLLSRITQNFGLKSLSPSLLSKTFYYLTQTHLLLFFFQGDLQFHDLENVWEKEKAIVRPNVKQFSCILLKDTLKTMNQKSDEKNTLQMNALGRYLSILKLVENESSSKIHIGIDLQMEKLYAETVTTMLIQSLDERNGVRMEPYRSEASYDLVITNTNAALFGKYPIKQEVYVLSELGSTYDLLQIKKEVHLILENKKKDFMQDQLKNTPK